MTQTEHLIGFIAMATAIAAILVIGTLAAADILHFGFRRSAADPDQPQRGRPARTGAESTSGEELAAGSSGDSGNFSTRSRSTVAPR